MGPGGGDRLKLPTPSVGSFTAELPVPTAPLVGSTLNNATPPAPGTNSYKISEPEGGPALTGGVDVFSGEPALHPAIATRPNENNNAPQIVQAAQRDMGPILGSGISEE